ncbi:MAG: agarase, partial [Verrucomicrobia bacterium]|nr:agarase [Verrucomicrobiota bacterium]
KSEDLKQDVQDEAAWLASLQPPTFDAYGGLPGSKEKLGLKQTGFFHVEKKDGRWILVDPDGNAFFHLGVCAFGPSDDYTYFAGREHIYEWLPARDGEFKTTFHPQAYWSPNVLSFHLVNIIRKFGQPYDPAAYTARMIERVRKWGFNSAGAFGAGDDGARRRADFPHVAHLPLATWEGFPDVPGTHGIFDPFSTKLRERCDKLFAEKLSPQAGDPLIIGYFLANEPLWEEIPGAVAALDASHPCKRRLAQMLEEKYKTIEEFNRAWETSLPSFAEVAARGLPVKNAAAKEDMRKFTGIFLDSYFRVVTGTFRKYDKNHMLIGNRFQPGTINNETVCRLSGKYMDVVSFNYYAYDFDRDLLARLRNWIGDRPMFFSEFYFSSPGDSGLSGGGKDVSCQRERGLAYRHYVEQAATLGYVVGIEWFTLVDQATSGRWFEKYTGEAANSGLIVVTDRPWKTMLAEMLKTNYDIYKVFLGEKAPFRFRDPRFDPAGKK